MNAPTTSGIDMPRPDSAATVERIYRALLRAASRAAIASLVIFVLARLVFGWMSIFGQLVGIVLPLVILAMLHWRRPGELLHR